MKNVLQKHRCQVLYEDEEKCQKKCQKIGVDVCDYPGDPEICGNVKWVRIWICIEHAKLPNY